MDIIAKARKSPQVFRFVALLSVITLLWFSYLVLAARLLHTTYFESTVSKVIANTFLGRQALDDQNAGHLVDTVTRSGWQEELDDSIIPALYAHGWYKDTREKYPGKKFLVRAPIPVVGVPVINNGHWLKRLVYSIDVPVRKIQLIFSTEPGATETDATVEAAIAEFNERLPPGHLAVHRPGCNLGVGGGWNSVWEHNLDAAWFLMVSSDVAFAPGALARIPDEVEDPRYQKILVFQYSASRFFVIRRQALDEIGVYDENLWPFSFDDNEYTSRVERVQALTPDVQRVAYCESTLPDGVKFSEIAHIHGTDETKGEYGKLWLDQFEEANQTSGALRSNPRYMARRGWLAINHYHYMLHKWNITFWPMRTVERLSLTWRIAFNNPDRGIPRWTLDPALRAAQVTMWNFDNDLENLVWLKYNFATMLPGDVQAGEFDKPNTDQLQIIFPEHLSQSKNLTELIRLQKPPCVSGFAAAEGLTSNLIKLRQELEASS